MKTHLTILVALAGLTGGAFAQKTDLRASSISSDTKDFRIGRTATLFSVLFCDSKTAVPASRAAYFLSTNSTISTIDQMIGSFAVPEIKSYHVYRHSMRWKVAGYIPNGDAYIGVFGDYQKRIAETDESNNTRSFKARFHGRPDLVVTRIGAPHELGLLQTKTLQVEVRNHGGETTGKACKLRLFLSKDDRFNIGDKLVGEATVPSIGGRGRRIVPTGLRIPSGTALGKWYLIAYVDASRQILREYWPNNQTKVSLTVFRAGAAVPYGAGCLGSNGRVKHDVVPVKDGPMIGRGVTVRMTHGPKSSISLVNLGFSRTRMGSLPLPLSLHRLGATKCWLYASMDLIVPASTTANGLATRTIPIPASQSFIGTQFYTQFLGVDRAANTLGLSFSNGVAITLGGRAP